MDANEKSKKLSLSVQNDLDDLHQRVGDYKRSTGLIFAIYARLRAALEANYLDEIQVRLIYNELKLALSGAVKPLFTEAVELGLYQAEKTNQIFGEDYQPDILKISQMQSASLQGMESLVTSQMALYLGLLMSGETSKSFLIGETPGSFGVMTPRPVITTIKNFTAGLVNSALSFFGMDPAYGYQAIAVLDKRTSPCCREVDGQIVKMGQPFQLTASPYYAEFMIKPPFHDGCRTTRAIIRLAEGF